LSGNEIRLADTFEAYKMSVILILLIASLTIASAFLGAFVWSVRNGQYDDDYTPSVRILFEDKKPADPSEENNPLTLPKNIDGTTESGR
jgi:cbb3-type cytochrome oxidase maturation protein